MSGFSRDESNTLFSRPCCCNDRTWPPASTATTCWPSYPPTTTICSEWHPVTPRHAARPFVLTLPKEFKSDLSSIDLLLSSSGFRHSFQLRSYNSPKSIYLLPGVRSKPYNGDVQVGWSLTNVQYRVWVRQIGPDTSYPLKEKATGL